MTREMISMVKCASTIATFSTELRTFVLTKILTKTMKKNKKSKKNSTSAIMSNANRPSSKITTKNAAGSRRKRSNTTLDHTVLNKEEPSFWVFSPMIHAPLSPTPPEVPMHTKHWQEALFLTLRIVSSPWTAFHAKSLKTTTTTETMPKTMTRSSKCVNKSTKVPESANKVSSQQDTSHQRTTMHATTLLESRLSERMESSLRLDRRQTRRPRFSLVSSLLPLFFWPHTFTTSRPSSTERLSTLRIKKISPSTFEF
mmetsp:Transcript_1701/g.3571  ORF Transcript_1701/g.3571 Transcript_1701/m.3571 type:complete len:256 (-) Transcript_1701:178-945(-)